MKKLFKFFESKAILYISPCVLAACVLFMLVAIIVDNSFSTFFEYLAQYLLCFLLLIGLVKTYNKHEKNAMKAILGSLLAVLVCIIITLINDNFAQLPLAIETFSGPFITGFVADCLVLLGMLFVAVMHFVINTDHHSSPKLVLVNQIVAIVIFIACIINIICTISAASKFQSHILSFLALSLGYYTIVIAVYSAVICVESKLDAFRIARENN